MGGKKKKTQIIRNETGANTNCFMVIKMIIKGYYEQLSAPKFDKLDDLDQFLERHDPPK